MTTNTLLGSEMKRLLCSVAQHGAMHLAEIETDLGQTGILLGEAIEKLHASFMAIHEAVTAQQQAVDMLMAGTATGPEIAASLLARREEIGAHVNAAITGLQFQDMTSQLIGRTLRRVAGLREALAEAGANGMPLESIQDVDEIAATLQRTGAALEQRSVTLERALWKAVCQTHMESGDIELF